MFVLTFSPLGEKVNTNMAFIHRQVKKSSLGKIVNNYRTWLELKSDSLFLGPKFRFLAQKSDFCHTTPILVDDPFLALGMTVNFPPWKPFFDFPFRSYSCFRKKIWLTAQKVFPPPTVGVPSASKSPSALSAQALRARALRARA